MPSLFSIRIAKCHAITDQPQWLLGLSCECLDLLISCIQTLHLRMFFRFTIGLASFDEYKMQNTLTAATMHMYALKARALWHARAHYYATNAKFRQSFCQITNGPMLILPDDQILSCPSSTDWMLEALADMLRLHYFLASSTTYQCWCFCQ